MEYERLVNEEYSYDNKDIILNELNNLNEDILKKEFDVDTLNGLDMVIKSLVGFNNLTFLTNKLILLKKDYLKKEKLVPKVPETIEENRLNEEIFYDTIFQNLNFVDYKEEIIKDLKSYFLIKLNCDKTYFYKCNNSFVGERMSSNLLSEEGIKMMEYVKEYEDYSIKKPTFEIEKKGGISQDTKFLILLNNKKISYLQKPKSYETSYQREINEIKNVAAFNNQSKTKMKSDTVIITDFLLDSSLFKNRFLDFIKELSGILGAHKSKKLDTEKKKDNSINGREFNLAITKFMLGTVNMYFDKAELKLDKSKFIHLINLANSDFILLVEFFANFLINNITDINNKEKLYISLVMTDSPVVNRRHLFKMNKMVSLIK